jgi:hypothetical protein
VAETFRCPGCGGDEFYEYRLDLVRQKQPANLVRGESLYANAYTNEWQWSEPETLFVSGYECAGCHALYAPDGTRCSEFLVEPQVYVGEPRGGGDEPRS